MVLQPAKQHAMRILLNMTPHEETLNPKTKPCGLLDEGCDGVSCCFDFLEGAIYRGLCMELLWGFI